ncbi:MAG: ChbG/HpnK family deacetylase [Acidobacteria bacterium]|nr:MAG: ChbG/HpnK family deacetylase [Acidobacteriota bacterium]
MLLGLAASMLASLSAATGQPSSIDAAGPTYAERLGWPPGTRALIVHVDDAGMSHESNLGALQSITEGIANSVSVMMPCPWVFEFAEMLRRHPEIDAGLHLTLTSEWDLYRWRPLLAGTAPGLLDDQGVLPATVAEVVGSATADEIEAEIRAQIAYARQLGIEPTHLDSHMGTLFATPQLLERYVEVGIDTGIPVMLPGGHATLLLQQLRAEGGAAAVERAAQLEQLGRQLGDHLWSSGLPVIDDLHNTTYGWIPGDGGEGLSDAELREYKVERYVAAMSELRPGITMMINHASAAGEHFLAISGSGPTRRGDLLALLDPRVAAAVAEQGIVLTTWRELMARRSAVAPAEAAATSGSAAAAQRAAAPRP